MDDDLTFLALRQFKANPKLSQRQLAPIGERALGISLGRTHYCVRALIERGPFLKHAGTWQQRDVEHLASVRTQSINC